MDNTPPAGPVEWAALAFPGPALDPRVVSLLRGIVAPGTVRLLDAAVIHRDDDGATTRTEVEDEGMPAFDDIDGDVLELLSEDDLVAVAAGLRPGTTTLVLVWENRWAVEFAESVRRAGGELAAHDRIPRDRLTEALGEPIRRGVSA